MKIKKSGYTLIELIIVMALIGLILSVSIPSISLIFNNKEKLELMEFIKDINYARSKAVMENDLYTLILYTEENKYIIFNKKMIVKEKFFTQGISIKSENLNSSITFYPTGTPNKAGKINLTNKKDKTITITITPATGKINLKNI